MQQDYVKSAVYSSLTKPPPSRCEPILDPGRCCPRIDPAKAYRESSELQLSRVSAGAEKLSRTIESLSRGPLHDGRSRHVAEGLLSGALDLQESLVMLRRLQGASVAMSRRRATPKSDFGVKALGFFRPSTRISSLQLQSADGSLRHGGEELKKVIRDRLHRQSLLSNSSDEEKACSSSASCSFGDGCYEPNKGLCSDPTAFHLKEEKPRSLVAKLMGLEEIPSGIVQPQKDNGKNKRFNRVKPDFDMEKLNARKLPSVEQIQDPTQKSLQEIIETMQFKGLLKSGQVEDQRIQSRLSRNSKTRKHSRDVLDDGEPPPIVVIKPSVLPSGKRESPKGLLSGKKSLKKEIHPSEYIREKREYGHELRLSRTPDRKAEKSKLKIFPEVNSPHTRIHRQHRKDAAVTCNKPDEAHQEPLNGKKQEIQNGIKATRNSQAKTSPATGSKHHKRPVGKKDVSKQASTVWKHSHNDSLKHFSDDTISSASERKAPGATAVRQSTPQKIVVSLLFKSDDAKLGDGKATNSIGESDSISVDITPPANDLPRQAEKQHRPCEKEGTRMDQKIFDGVIPKSIKVEKKYEFAEAVHFSDQKTIIRKSTGVRCNIKRLLLSSQSFLNLARELFTLNSQKPSYYHRRKEDVIVRNAKLFIDCGKELLTRKRHEQELLNHPLQQSCAQDFSVYYSLDQLAEEISSEIEDLIAHCNVDVNANSRGSLYIRQERDLRCKDMMVDVISRICSRNWICITESDQLAVEVEEHILSFLVEEIIAESAS